MNMYASFVYYYKVASRINENLPSCSMPQSRAPIDLNHNHAVGVRFNKCKTIDCMTMHGKNEIPHLISHPQPQTPSPISSSFLVPNNRQQSPHIPSRQKHPTVQRHKQLLHFIISFQPRTRNLKRRISFITRPPPPYACACVHIITTISNILNAPGPHATQAKHTSSSIHFTLRFCSNQNVTTN